MPKLRNLIAIGAGLLLTLALTGCSGNSDAAGASVGAAGGSERSINLSESAAKLSDLKSFRFSATASLEFEGGMPTAAEDAFGGALLEMLLGSLKDVKVEGAVVAPDQMELNLKIAGQDLGFVQIGDKAWAKLFGSWERVESGDLGFDGGINLDDLAIDVLPVDVVQAAKVTKEKVNGIDATRYSFDKKALQSLADDIDAGQEIESANMDVWLTDDGVPVKIALKLAGKSEDGEKVKLQFEFALSDLNGNITIKAPK